MAPSSHSYGRDAATTAARAEALIAFATAQGLAHRVVHGRLLLGWALAMQGDAAAGVTHLQAGFEGLQRTGHKLYRPYFLGLLAEASGQAGQPEAGVTVLTEALTLVAATEERWWEAEVYRLQGELLLQLPLPMSARRTPVSSRRWTSPVASRRRPWSCAPR